MDKKPAAGQIPTPRAARGWPHFFFPTPAALQLPCILSVNLVVHAGSLPLCGSPAKNLFSDFKSRMRIPSSVRRSGFLVLYLFCVNLPAQDLPGQEFTIVVLPDTQIVSQDYPEIFARQTQWIVDNAAGMNVRVVLGLGDIVNDAESVAQWQNADTAIRLLDGKVPYALAIGNHDYDNENPSSRSALNYNQYFGRARYAAYSWYRGSFSDAGNENFWIEFTANGQSYIVLVLEFHPRDAVLDWARAVLEANAGKPVVLVTHAFTYNDGTRIDQCDTSDMTAAGGNNGEVMWEKFVRDSNAMMVLSGHITSGSPARRADVAGGGQLVHQMLSNYQTQPLGGGGYLRVLRFVPAEGRIEVKTYSPWLDAYLTDAANQFDLPMVPDPTLPSGVSGRVRGLDCAAISEAAVSTSEAVTASDGGGYFSLSATPGPHPVTVQKDGWVPQTRDVTVLPGYPAHLDFFLSAFTGCSAGAADPSVNICAPAEGASVTSPVRVIATAHSSKGVSYSQIYVDGVKVFQVGGPTLDTNVTMAPGTRRLTVQVRDAAGALFKQTIFFTVAESEPPPPDPGCTTPTTELTVNICTPAEGASVSSPVRITAKANSSAGVAVMQVYVDGAKAFETIGAALDTSLAMTTGTRRVTVQARDRAGKVFKKTVFITVTSEPPPAGCTMSTESPSVTICQPTDGATVSSPVRVVAGATSSSPVKFLQVYVDGAKVYQVNGAQLDTALPMAAGTRRVTVQAKDANGLVFKKGVVITVSP